MRSRSLTIVSYLEEVKRLDYNQTRKRGYIDEKCMVYNYAVSQLFIMTLSDLGPIKNHHEITTVQGSSINIIKWSGKLISAFYKAGWAYRTMWKVPICRNVPTTD